MPGRNNLDTTTGLDSNIAAALSYVFGPLSGLLFLLLEKNSYIRFHSLQSIIVLGGLIVLDRVLALTAILEPLGQIVWLVYFILMLVFVYKASVGERWQVPFLRKFTSRILRRV